MSELQHYGIRGMKWGRRRPEGPDGRVQSGSATSTASEDSKTAAAASAKAKAHGVSALSNKELQDLNNRLNLEQNYSRLTSEGVSKGRDYVGMAKTALDISDSIDRGISNIPKPAQKAIKTLAVNSLPSGAVSLGKTVLTVGKHVKTGARIGVGIADTINKNRS